MRSLILMPIMILCLTSCASKKTNMEIKEEVAQTSSIKNESELYSVQKEILAESKNLTPQQRMKLSDLIQKSKIQNQAMQDEIAKTKAVLFKELVSEKENRYKIKTLEGQLLKLNRKKTRNSLSTYREARDIVGKSDVPLEKTLMMIDNRTINNL